MEERYQLVHDNDGHDYCILESQHDEFENWLDHEELYYNTEWNGFDFNTVRVEGSLTFTNPEF